MQTQDFSFDDTLGRRRKTQLTLPDHGKPRAYAVLAYCHPTPRTLLDAVNSALTHAGYGVMQLELIGSNEDCGFDVLRANAAAAVAALGKAKEPPALLIGHSLAGSVLLAAAKDCPDSRAFAVLNAPLAAEQIADPTPKPCAEGLERDGLLRQVGALRQPLLIVHGAQDSAVPDEAASALLGAAPSPKSYTSLATDSRFATSEDATLAAQLIVAWAQRHVVGEHSPAGASKRDDAVIAKTGSSGFYTEVSAGEHVLIADEPVSYGGTDRGPSPYDLLAAGLAACTTMTLRMYADRKQLPLQSATVAVRHDKIHARDCEDCDEKPRKVDRFRRELVLEGELDEPARQRLLEIADRCPVHRTLHSEIQIDTRLKDS